MPQRSTQTLLCDLLESVQVIEDFTVGLSFDSYRASLLLQSGVERQLENLAADALCLRDAIEQLCPAIDWQAVYGLGNFLRHRHHTICHRKLWDAIHHELPLIAAAVRQALKNSPPPAPEA